MSNPEDGGPAFPSPLEWRETEIEDGGEVMRSGVFDNGQDGMSLRDYFAAKAMQGYLSSPDIDGWCESDGELAEAAYATADAMLAQRKKASP